MHGVDVGKGGLSGEQGFIRIVGYIPLSRNIGLGLPRISRLGREREILLTHRNCKPRYIPEPRNSEASLCNE